MKASVILQDYLDRMGPRVLKGDFDGYRAAVRLPFLLITATGQITVNDEAELRAGFDAFREMLQSQRVTDYISLVSQAMLIDENLLSGHYMTHIMSSGTHMVPPFPSHMVQRREPGGPWQAVAITNGMRTRNWPVQVLRVAPPEGDEA